MVGMNFAVSITAVGLFKRIETIATDRIYRAIQKNWGGQELK